MPMDSEMNDISLSDFTPYTIVASLEMSDEPYIVTLLGFLPLRIQSSLPYRPTKSSVLKKHQILQQDNLSVIKTNE